MFELLPHFAKWATGLLESGLPLSPEKRDIDNPDQRISESAEQRPASSSLNLGWAGGQRQSRLGGCPKGLRTSQTLSEGSKNLS